jgi:hypothetical protein
MVDRGFGYPRESEGTLKRAPSARVLAKSTSMQEELMLQSSSEF